MIFTAPHELAATNIPPTGAHVTELTKRPGLSLSAFATGATGPAPWLENAAVTASDCLATGLGTALVYTQTLLSSDPTAM